MTMRRFIVLLWLALMLATVGVATADIIPTLDSISPAGSAFTFNYQVDVTVQERVESGDFFTIYDFGDVSSVALVAGWTFSTALIGVTPLDVSPNDSPNVMNVTFTRTGGAILGPLDLGIFSVVSPLSGTHADSFTALATRNSGGSLDGTKIANIGLLNVPGPVTATVPEPMTVFLLGLGLIGMTLARRSR
jgi:hypothetical protein